jgi:hypothetical protein
VATDGPRRRNDDRRRAPAISRWRRGRASERSRSREPRYHLGRRRDRAALYHVGRALEDRGGRRRRGASYFARAGLLAVEQAEGIRDDRAPDGDPGAAPITVRTRLAAIRARRAAARQSPLTEMPWCAAPPLAEPPQLARLR